MLHTWEDPPESAERERKWDATFDDLKQNPERWAKLFVGKDRNAHSLGGRLRKLYPDYEIMTRTVKKKKNVKQAGVWARYAESPTMDEDRAALNEAYESAVDDAFNDGLTTGPMTIGGGASVDG